MLTAVFKYSYPNAKVRAMKGTLFSADMFAHLLKTGSYQEFLSLLHSTHYMQTTAETGQDLSLPLLSKLLHASLFADYEKIIAALEGDVQKFFILLYHKYELTNLKTILRGICGQIPSEEIAPLLLPTERYPLFSKPDVLALRDVFAIIEHLQGTFFEYPLNRALHRFEKERVFFPLEMALDLHYYQTLWESVGKLPEEEREIIQKILGMVFDALNIAWITRFKEHYHFSQEEILNYTIEHGYTLRLQERRKLAAIQNTQEIFAYLKNTIYGKKLVPDQPLNTLHISLTRYVMTQLHPYFIGQPFQIGVILGYVLLKEYEVSDLITIAEAKKYGLSSEQTQPYVIHG